MKCREVLNIYGRLYYFASHITVGREMNCWIIGQDAAATFFSPHAAAAFATHAHSLKTRRKVTSAYRHDDASKKFRAIDVTIDTKSAARCAAMRISFTHAIRDDCRHSLELERET